MPYRYASYTAAATPLTPHYRSYCLLALQLLQVAELQQQQQQLTSIRCTIALLCCARHTHIAISANCVSRATRGKAGEGRAARKETPLTTLLQHSRCILRQARCYFLLLLLILLQCYSIISSSAYTQVRVCYRCTAPTASLFLCLCELCQ
jgi:hypothetical protein